MSFLIGVEIDNRRIAWIYDSEQPRTGQLKLTTVADSQKNAVIKFYLKKSNKTQLLCTENLTGIPVMHAGEPAIDISSSVNGKTFDYQISINRQVVRRSKYDLSKYLRSFKPLIVTASVITAAAIAAMLIILIVLPLLKPKPGESAFSGTQQTASAEKQQSREPSEPETPAVAEKDTDSEKPLNESSSHSESPTQSKAEPAPAQKEAVFIENEITDSFSVYFTPDSDLLTNKASTELDDFISRLPAEDDFDEGLFKIEIRGHCARYGTEEGRAELSKERALTVYNFLKGRWGIEADSVVTGAGAAEPVTLDREEQYLNRRVDINIKGNIRKVTTSE